MNGSTPSSTRVPLRQIAGLFLKLGALAFGGPAVHIAVMEEQIVRQRGWITRQEYLDLISAANLIPGPNSTEVAIHVGYRKGGWAGLVVAGACFILPAALLVTAIGWAYVTWGKLPAIAGILYGVKPAVLAVIGQALWRLGKAAVKSSLLAVVGALAIVAAAWGVHELIVLFAGGALVAALAWIPRRGAAPGTPLLALLWPTSFWKSAASVPALATTTAATTTATASASLLPLFFVFLKIGSVIFGSGYVLLAFLRADLVVHRQWLTESQLLDAVAVGQVTPGPVFTTATFIGYLLAGPWGALLATLGIFLPAFFFVALTAPFLPYLRQSRLAGAFLDGLNIASMALMTVVTAQLAWATLVPATHPWRIDYLALAITLASLAVLLFTKLNSLYLIVAAALLGLLVSW